MSPVRTFESNTPDVVYENFGDEVILLNLISGNYYSLNPVGMAYWELLSQGAPVHEVAELAASVYGQASERPIEASTVTEDLERLVTEFVAESLLRPSAKSRCARDITLQAALPKFYSAPELSKFDEVAEMLLLDPVHDIAPAGWPHPAPVKREDERRSGAAGGA